jgi:hypothetical protein
MMVTNKKMAKDKSTNNDNTAVSTRSNPALPPETKVVSNVVVDGRIVADVLPGVQR